MQFSHLFVEIGVTNNKTFHITVACKTSETELARFDMVAATNILILVGAELHEPERLDFEVYGLEWRV